MQQQLTVSLHSDVQKIRQIAVVPSLLDVIAETTGMGFVAVARVTESTWMACSVKDNIAFGLQPGGELPIKSTICNEIRTHQQPVVIDDVHLDTDYCNHPTPALYGFRSYISIPIIKKDGTFFGTLCAIDPRPNKVNTPSIVNLFTHFADLIAFHLQAVEELADSQHSLAEERLQHQLFRDEQLLFSGGLEKLVQQRTQELQQKNEVLQRMNEELKSFSYVASHDLQEPLRKVKFYTDRVLNSEASRLSPAGIEDLNRVFGAATRMQQLVKDLIAYPQATLEQQHLETVDMGELAARVVDQLSDEITAKAIRIHLDVRDQLPCIPFQLRQLFDNLLTNAIKFSRPGQPQVWIVGKLVAASAISKPGHSGHARYYHLQIKDNGIGFPQEFSKRIFQLFQRLHNQAAYEGTGIGLAIVHKVVENHHGYIEALGVPGEGAQFDVYLPYRTV